MRIGLGLSIVNTTGGPFEPTSLDLSGYWRASYGGSPWSGTATKGASGSRSLTEATNYPAVGTAVNGFDPASFDGSNDKLTGATDSNFVSAGAGTFFGLVKPITGAVDNATVYLNKPIWNDKSQAYKGAGFSNNGFRPFLYEQATSTYKSLTIACSLNAWHFVAMTWNGTNLFGRVDGTTGTIACGATILGGTAVQVGVTYNSGAFANMDVLELGFASTALSDANLVKIRDYMASRYNLTLT